MEPVALIAGAAFVAGLAIGVALGVRARARTRRLREGARELAGGNLAHRVILAGHDDAAAIADDLNALADVMQRESEASRMQEAARSALVANISHDLRTPITSIAGYVDALQRGLGDDPERYLAVIAAKTDELAELTDDLFYESRLDSGDLTLTLARVDLAEAARRAVLDFEPQLAARGVHVSADIPDAPCIVEADPKALRRILGNLVSNAIRHGERMTRFHVRVTAGERGCEVCFANDGAALPMDVERLFERGVAGSGGAGLGLSIARELAGRMGATVHAEKDATGTVSFIVDFRES